jgi:hypothetical protein
MTRVDLKKPACFLGGWRPVDLRAIFFRWRFTPPGMEVGVGGGPNTEM